MKLIFPTGMMLLGFSLAGTALAQNINSFTLTQEGSGQVAAIAQEGTNNTSETVLFQLLPGSDNSADILQTGIDNDNFAWAVQIGGSFNILTVEQSGIGNINNLPGNIEQYFGHDNIASFTQTGTDNMNTGRGLQLGGDLNQLTLTQRGDNNNNFGNIIQDFDGNTASLFQEGSGNENWSILGQAGGNLGSIQQDGVNTINWSLAEQWGSGNEILVQQSGVGGNNSSEIYQNGAGNLASVTQN